MTEVISEAVADEAVLVWSQPNCVQCKTTYKALDNKGIAYTKKNLLEHPEKAEEFREKAYLQAPIVQAPNGEWYGFRPDLIAGIKN